MPSSHCVLTSVRRSYRHGLGLVTATLGPLPTNHWLTRNETGHDAARMRLTISGAAVLLVAFSAANCSARVDQSAAATTYLTIAEAWSAPDADSNMVAAYRLFSTPMLQETCSRTASAARLVAPTAITLRIKESFYLTALKIVAMDSSGRPLPPVPLGIDVADADARLLDLRADVIANATVLAVRSGTVTFRAQTICPGMRATTFVTAVVLER